MEHRELTGRARFRFGTLPWQHWDIKSGHFNDEGEYLADRLTDEAIKFIQENQEDPFFLYLAHYAVHTPIEAKEELVRKYIDAEKDGCHQDPVYAAMIESVDESVGRVMKTLEELDIEDNTVVVFFSDNGGYGPVTCMDPLRGSKGMFYEGGIREPMLVKWPKHVKPGTVCEEPVIGIDFFPTFLEIAGIPPPAEKVLDGISLLPIVTWRTIPGEGNAILAFPGLPSKVQRRHGGCPRYFVQKQAGECNSKE